MPVAAPGPRQLAKKGRPGGSPDQSAKLCWGGNQRDKVRPNLGAAGPDRWLSGSWPFRRADGRPNDVLNWHTFGMALASPPINCRSLSASLFAAIGWCPRLGELHEFNQARRINQGAAVLLHQHQTACVRGFVKRGHGQRGNLAGDLHRQSRAILPSGFSEAVSGRAPASFSKAGRGGFRRSIRHRARS